MKNLLFITLFTISSSLFGQSDHIVINWIETDSIPFFQNALYDDSGNSLPHYTKKYPLNDLQQLPVVQIDRFRSTPISNQSIPWKIIKQPGNKPLLEYEIVRENKRPYLIIKIQPFITNEISGQVERINSMDLNIIYEPAIASLKSTMSKNFISNSVLSSGSWYKIAVEETGIHKLTFNQLQEIGLMNPQNVRIFGSGGILLPEDFALGDKDDLSATPLYFEKGSDNSFGPGDYILFFAQGPEEWRYNEADQFFSHKLHDYSWRGYYFITDNHGQPDVIDNLELSSDQETHTITSYDHLQFVEEETYNLLHSGKEWYGYNYNVNLSSSYPFTIPDRVGGENVRIRVKGAARSNENSIIRATANGDLLGDLTISSTNLSSYTSTYAYEETKIFSYTPDLDVVTVTVEYLRPNSNSEAWLNSITINVRNKLILSKDQMIFRDSRSIGFGNIGLFRIDNATGKTVIWEVTDANNPTQANFTLSGSTAEFKVETDEIRTFIAFKPSGAFPSPVYDEEDLGLIKNQNLHGLSAPDMIIIYPEEFEDQTKRLADFRVENDGLEVIMIEQNQVFNEFSSGTPDATAIRNFLKMFYEREDGDMPRYLLLFGDGSYDNRNQTAHNPNKILTYQSNNSLSPTRSYVSDDYFGLLDTGESLYSGLVDIGIGRLPVSTSEEADDLVDKIISYSSKKNLGDWRNYLCFIGDDGDANIHMKQANILAKYVESNYPNFNIHKIYLDAYPQVTTPTGDRYPDVTRALNEQVEKGALIINYTGHGGPNGLAHEQILTRTHINSWTNEDRLPLFMTATCEFSRYDEYNFKEDVEETSAGEEVLLNNKGGGIALCTTTRLVYSGPNHALNEQFYKIIFEKDENNKPYRLGDIIKYSKNNTGVGINKRNFTLLGDPSLKLVTPEHIVITDSINGIHTGEFTDTISALEYITISGHLEDVSGTKLENVNGIVNPVVYDKERRIETLANDGGSTWEFNARNSVLYKGAATVENGTFSFGFYIPKDINYSFGYGKISYYGNDTLTDAHGSSSALLVGGIGEDIPSDNIAPEIEIFMNDSLFKSGGITDKNPELLVYIDDNFGINTTGNGIGHDITATLDDDRLNAIILNEFYQSNINSYNSGIVRYPYSELEPGRHDVTVKVWDIHNNSAESTISFIVVESEKMLLEQLNNYPNPFFDKTWFNIEHNRPDEEMQVIIRIFNLSGQLVRVIESDVFSGGYRINPIEWDGSGSGGATLGGGTYIYEVFLTTETGEEASGSGKMIIIR